jgi:hypothetical protein
VSQFCLHYFTGIVDGFRDFPYGWGNRLHWLYMIIETNDMHKTAMNIKGGSNMTGTICV